MKRRQCTGCQQVKHPSKFLMDWRRGTLRTKCKACMYEQINARRARKREQKRGPVCPWWRTPYQDEQIAQVSRQRLPPDRQIKGRCAIDEVGWDEDE